MTFLQLSTSYPPGQSLGGFASGTGAAGIVGAGLWLSLKGLGVRVGLGIMGFAPWGLLALLWGVLRLDVQADGIVSDTDDEASELEEEDQVDVPKRRRQEPGDGLTVAEKFTLAKPLIFPYMLPLFCVYVFEVSLDLCQILLVTCLH